MRKTLITLCFCTHSLFAISSSEEAKLHSLFLMQHNQIDEALDRYREYCELSGHHDFSVLQQMGLIMLQKGIQTTDPQVYLMTRLGAGISGSSGALEILAKGLDDRDPQSDWTANSGKISGTRPKLSAFSSAARRSDESDAWSLM